MSTHLQPYRARYYTEEGDSVLECHLCPRRCRMKPGQKGLCFVRENIDGEMVLSTYGRSSGFCIDPVEKKPLNHFMPGTPVLSFGTAGCNLTCRFCQNWSISKSKQVDTLASDASPREIACTAAAYNALSIAYTYNDPVIFIEYAVDTAEAAHAQGLYNIAVTAGYIEPVAAEEFFRPMDAVNIDLKGFTERFYKKLSSAALKPVLDTILYLREKTDIWFEITTLLIPGENDSDHELREMTAWVRKYTGPHTPVHFSAFHPDYRMLNTPPTPSATLQRAREIALDNGLYYVYTGNVYDPEGQSTYCPGCGQKVIGRDSYIITEYHLNSRGECQHCRRPLEGVFASEAGDWGRRRLPVQPVRE